MDDDPSLWHPILVYWRTARPQGGRTWEGLSFSFLVGATREPIGKLFADEQAALDYSGVLYKEVAAQEEAYFEECGFVRDWVVKLGGRTGPLPSFDSVWQRFRSEIVSGKFSVTNGIPGTFQPEEEAWIVAAKKLARTQSTSSNR